MAGAPLLIIALGERASGAPAPLLARPIGSWSPAGVLGSAAMGGALVEVEGGGAAIFASGPEPARGSFAFGARGGWAFANGLAVHARYDDLGIRPSPSSGPLQFVTGGLRYSLPFVVPLPFGEVDVGGGFGATSLSVGGSGGIGLSLPLGAHFVVDLVGRDWLASVGGSLRQTLSAGVGLTVTFASPPQ